MSLDVEVNPRDLEDEYVSGLNRSFGHWGDRRTYEWAFEREVGARAADLMVLRDGGQIVAGSAVSYRQVRSGEEAFLTGVMTGSWTLPQARGKGAFSRVIDESRRLLAARGGTALIAFVTHDNASRRRLVAAGCLEVPTWYVVSNSATPRPASALAVEPSTVTVDELFRAYRRWQSAGPGAYVVYPSVEVWSSQYLERPLPVERLAVAGCHCLVERAASSDRALWIAGRDPAAAVAALLARAIETERQLFFFTAQARLARTGIDLGMVAKPGSITVLDAIETPAEGLSRSGRARGVAVTGWRPRLTGVAGADSLLGNFFLNVPIGVIAMFVAMRTVTESVSEEERPARHPGPGARDGGALQPDLRWRSLRATRWRPRSRSGCSPRSSSCRSTCS